MNIKNLIKPGKRRQITDEQWQALALLDDSQVTCKLLHVMGLESISELKGFRKGFALAMGLKVKGVL